MEKSYNVAVLVGSLRKGSYSRKIARAFAALAPKNLDFRFIEIGDLPFYNEDTDSGTPPAVWTDFRKKMKEADAYLFVTPEYNRSVPGVLKNAVDVASRPYGQNTMAGKPAAVISTSIGALAGFGANHHLRQSLVFLDVPTMQQPEAYIGRSAEFLDEAGNPATEANKKFLEGIITAFASWIKTIKKD